MDFREFLKEVSLSSYIINKKQIKQREIKSYLINALKSKKMTAISVGDDAVEIKVSEDNNKEPAIIYVTLNGGLEYDTGNMKDSYAVIQGGSKFNDYSPKGTLGQQLSKIVKAFVTYKKSDWDKSILETIPR
jgi:hypothetical protein|tara:strand:+ start:1228 stop:1623 length:396 start_codon:yes stop_codon:yes gene_type:complete